MGRGRKAGEQPEVIPFGKNPFAGVKPEAQIASPRRRSLPDQTLTRLRDEHVETVEREHRERFEAHYWTYWQAVAWIYHRSSRQLDDYVLPDQQRCFRWYNSEAGKHLRIAIERGELAAFDFSGRQIERAAVLGRDPQLRFFSADIKGRWTAEFSPLPQAEQAMNGRHASGGREPERTPTSRKTDEDRDDDALKVLWEIARPFLDRGEMVPNYKEHSKEAKPILRQRHPTDYAKAGRVDELAKIHFAGKRRKRGVRR